MFPKYLSFVGVLFSLLFKKLSPSSLHFSPHVLSNSLILSDIML